MPATSAVAFLFMENYKTVGKKHMARYTVINDNKVFRRVYAKGRFKADSLLVTYVYKNRLPIMRVGITASRKIGNAVCRNRARRVIRAALYEYMDQIKPGIDIVFVARSATAKSSSIQVAKSMRRQLLACDAFINKEKNDLP